MGENGMVFWYGRSYSFLIRCRNDQAGSIFGVIFDHHGLRFWLHEVTTANSVRQVNARAPEYDLVIEHEVWGRKGEILYTTTLERISYM